MSLPETNNAVLTLQEVCSTESLDNTKDILEQCNVVMEADGTVEFACGHDITKSLKRHRKNLVLGLDGHDQHSLEEANKIIEDRRSSVFTRAKNFIKGSV